jgi:ribosomal subunit interface protein
MHVTISGHQMELGEALQAHAVERLKGLQDYLHGLGEAHVVFAQESHHHHLHQAVVTAHAGGLVLHAEGSGIDAYAALDDAAAKLGKQLDKYKGRLAKHRERRKKFSEKLKGLAPISFESISVSETDLEDVPAETFDGFGSQVVKREIDSISPMTVDEAVMQMDLLHKPAFLFLNVGSGQLNMVYREDDARVRWVAPKA